MAKQNCPCRLCQDRWRDGSKTCHQECDKYKDWRSDHHERMREIRHEQYMEFATNSIIYSKRKKNK